MIGSILLYRRAGFVRSPHLGQCAAACGPVAGPPVRGQVAVHRRRVLDDANALLLDEGRGPGPVRGAVWKLPCHTQGSRDRRQRRGAELWLL